MESGQNCHERPSSGEWETRCCAQDDQDLARPVLLPVPPQRSLLQHEHIIARWLTQSAPSRTRDLAEPPNAGATWAAIRSAPAVAKTQIIFGARYELPTARPRLHVPWRESRMMRCRRGNDARGFR